jgi:putative flippase GtrA
MTGRVIRFLVAGSLMTLLAYAMFIGAIWVGLGYRLANPISWAGGVAVGAATNRWFTFRTESPWARWLPLYIAGALLQLGVSALGYEVLIGILGLPPTPAFIINTGFTAATNFLFLNFVAFRPA